MTAVHGIRPADRERGSRDWRLMPVAALVWATALLCSWTGLDRLAGGVPQMPWISWKSWASWETWMIGVVGAAVSVALAACAAMVAMGVTRGGGHATPQAIACYAAVAAAAVLAAGCSACVHGWIASSNPVQRIVAASERGAYVGAAVRVNGPAVSSDRRGFDCRADVVVTALQRDGVLTSSRAQARLYAVGDACVLEQGGDYWLRGKVERPAFGSADAWLTVSEEVAPSLIRRPSLPLRAVRRMQAAFLQVTDGLDDQGRVLVPGLTIGMLGSEVADPSMRGGTAREPVDPAYAQRLEDAFRVSGIMHLMAVSGGHFALVAVLARRLCGLLRVERPWMPAIVAGSYAPLAALMAPSDSVLRAMAMGFMGALALLIGRRSQGMSMLCVTATGVIIIRPGMASSLGFALSCAAVAGIILWAEPIAGGLSRIMPTALAEAIGVTVAAQIPALPLQALMDPDLPVLGVLANLLTAPVVCLATLAGLLGLVVSWLAPSAGFCCAWVASCGTRVMEAVALWVAESPFAVLPWGKGPAAAIALAGCEAAAMLAVRWAFRRRARRRGTAREDSVCDGPGGDGGAEYRPSPSERVGAWLEETRRMLSTDAA